MENKDEFQQQLHKLNKNCQFVNITAEQYQQEIIQDAFINGLASKKTTFTRNLSLDSQSGL